MPPRWRCATAWSPGWAATRWDGRSSPTPRSIDLDGAFVAPAFVDSHVHLTATGLRLTGLDLSGRRRVATHCLQLVAEHVAAHPGQPIWGHGWDDTAWPAADPAPPMSTPSSAPLPGLPGAGRRPLGGGLHDTARSWWPACRRSHGFDPQRPLSADAHHLVRAEARRLLTWQQRDDARRAALDAAAAAGIVAVHECAGPQIGGAEDWQELRACDHGVEVVGYWGEAVSSAAQARALIDGHRRPRAGR